MYSYPTTKEEWWNIVNKYKKNLLELINKFNYKELELSKILIENKDNNICRILHDTWFKAPDKSWIHELQGWEQLCDLCSEDYLLYEDIYDEDKYLPEED